MIRRLLELSGLLKERLKSCNSYFEDYALRQAQEPSLSKGSVLLKAWFIHSPATNSYHHGALRGVNFLSPKMVLK